MYSVVCHVNICTVWCVMLTYVQYHSNKSYYVLYIVITQLYFQ